MGPVLMAWLRAYEDMQTEILVSSGSDFQKQQGKVHAARQLLNELCQHNTT